MDEHSRRMLLAASTVAALLTLLFLAGVFNTYQQRLADSLYGGRPPMEDIVIIGIDDRSLQEIGRWPWPRETTIKLLPLTQQARVTAVDIAFLEPSTTRADAILAAAARERPLVLVSEYVGINELQEHLLKPRFPANTGYANIPIDSDGIVRAINLDLGDEPAFSAAIYANITGQEFPKTGRFLINFAGPPGTFTYYSAADVLRGRIDPSEFEDKIVLIGATANDLRDTALVPTSGGRPMPGIEIHANALQTMLLGDELRIVPQWITAALIVAVAFLLAFIVLRFSVATAGAAAVLLLLGYIFAAGLLFGRGYIANILYIPLAIVLCFIVFVAVDLINERMMRSKVASAFGKYVSPAIVEQIMSKEIELGGERREITILFSDIRGFTSISERLSAEELVEFLNAYFTRVTKVIMLEGGLVDKFIGDAVMAFWNAPVTDADHAEHAVVAALEMCAVIDLVRKEHGGKHAHLGFGIGINTGEAVVGNVGSIDRLNYTAIGDSVNIASRLEGLTKTYGVHIIISESTKRKLKGDFAFRELDRVKVKGKKEPVTIYEVAGWRKKVRAAQLEHIEQYERSLKRYYEGDWADAARGFAKLHDPASKLMHARCKEFSASPPRHWDGVYEMTHK